MKRFNAQIIASKSRCTGNHTVLTDLLPRGTGRLRPDEPLRRLVSKSGGDAAWRGQPLAERNPFGCPYQDVTGRFMPHAAQLALGPHLMERVRRGLPFTWLRWGDGEMGYCNKHLLRRLFASWQHTPSAFFVAVGVRWLCQPRLKQYWNEQARHAGNFTFVDGFYLVSGAPMATEDGIDGWLIASAGRPIVLVGPPHLRNLTFLNHSRFVQLPPRQSFGPEAVPALLASMRAAGEAIAPRDFACVIFAVAGGTMAKWLITAAHGSPWARHHTFLDIGSTFDGFVGRASRNYIDVKLLCEFSATARYWQREWQRREWMAPGVCAAAGAAHCPTLEDPGRRCQGA